MIKGRLEEKMITLLNIYAPPSSNWSFYRQMFDLMALEAEGTPISGGDLNLRLNAQLDSSAGGRQNTSVINAEN